MERAWPDVAPDILILGQVTVDDTVPASPGPWHRRLGGNALYAAAGARLWCLAERIGIVARVSTSLPFDLPQVLEQAGLSAQGLAPVAVEPLIEWIVYEEDGNRQSLPRNAALRDPAASAGELLSRYLGHLENLSASYEDIPTEWLPAQAIHLAPQVLSRHLASCQALAGRCAFLSVDPSPHYSRGRDAEQLAAMLPGVTAFLPSQAEVQHLARVWPDWPAATMALHQAAFAEVLLKRGAAGALLAHEGQAYPIRAAPAEVLDLTGAGDAFSGAYCASRALGHTPKEAAARAAVAAAMVVECAGTQEALALNPRDAEARLLEYLGGT
jgi:sugar/nucleoside kinase (ribokinase family)